MRINLEAIDAYAKEQLEKAAKIEDAVVSAEVSSFVILMTDRMRNDFVAPDTAYQPWMGCNEYAYHLMDCFAANTTDDIRHERFQRGARGVLVLVKAQHPLQADGTPGYEYQARLDAAIAYCRETLTAGDRDLSVLFVGGVHEGSAVPLAKAGADYFREHADFEYCEMIRKVYSGNDEDWLAGDIFLGDQSFVDVAVCCSIGQLARAYLCWLMKGVIPDFRTVTFRRRNSRPHQRFVLELTGGWSVRGMLEGGIVNAFIAAAETAAKHRREAEAALATAE